MLPQVDGIKELTAFAPENAQEVIDNLDLLLKVLSFLALLGYKKVQMLTQTALLDVVAAYGAEGVQYVGASRGARAPQGAHGAVCCELVLPLGFGGSGHSAGAAAGDGQVPLPFLFFLSVPK